MIKQRNTKCVGTHLDEYVKLHSFCFFCHWLVIVLQLQNVLITIYYTHISDALYLKREY